VAGRDRDKRPGASLASLHARDAAWLRELLALADLAAVRVGLRDEANGGDEASLASLLARAHETVAALRLERAGFTLALDRRGDGSVGARLSSGATR
jgi:hypothetical protein